MKAPLVQHYFVKRIGQNKILQMEWNEIETSSSFYEDVLVSRENHFLISLVSGDDSMGQINKCPPRSFDIFIVCFR